jgi:catechol 2,3-dioxygenase-like lactoylglutathione lyase family enzyme
MAKRWLMLFAFVLGLSACAASGTDMPSAADVKPTDFRRITLIVSDIERSLALYRDVLGFEANYDSILEMSGVALPAGQPGAKARLVLLEANDPWVGWIGLLQWLGPPLDPRQDMPQRLGIGDTVMVFNTTRIDQRCAAIKALKSIRFTAAPSTTTYPGRGDGPDIYVRGCNFFDADGYFIELNQILAGPPS